MIRKSGSAHRRQRGAILVQTLLVTAALVALIVTMAANEGVMLEQTQNSMRQQRIEAGAQSGVARAMTVLATANTNLVTLNDDWAQLGDNGDTSYDLGSGTTFRIQIIDSAALINVNTLTAAQMALLPLTQDEVAGLTDWKSAGETESANGAKDDFYNGLTVPYDAKLGNLTTVNELLLINGWIASDLYGTQPQATTTNGPLQDANGNVIPLIALLTADSGMPNTQASGAARTALSANFLSGQRITTATGAAYTAANLPATWATLLGSRGVTATNAATLLNTYTVTSDGGGRLTNRVNLNTASQAVLETIPSLTSATASAIVAQQTTGLTSLGAMTTISGLNSVPVLAQIAGYVGVGSDTFVARIYSESGGIGQAYEVLIGIRSTTGRGTTGTTTTTGVSSGSAPLVLAYNRLSTPGIPAYWSWTPKSSNTVDAGALQTTTGATTTTTTSGGSGGAAGGATGGRG